MNKYKEVEDLTGKSFNRWTVVNRAKDRYKKNGGRSVYWNCVCECGTRREVLHKSLVALKTMSCGCYQKEVVTKISKSMVSPFKYEIGEDIKTNKGSVKILGRTRTKNNKSGKFYYYECNKCGYKCDEKHIIAENSLRKGHGCSICGGGNAVKKGINDISTTAPWMVPYFNNINDAFTHSIGSRDVIEWKCPDCKFVFNRILTNVHSQGFHCPLCYDGHSFPEKFILSLLNQLNINYIWQLTNKNFKWCGKYKYDFYLLDYNLIIETHGEQHYFNNGAFKLSVDEQKNIDKIKKQLVLDNSLEYVEIDCRYSKLEWIKKSIICELEKYINLNNVDWNKCCEEATSNLTKKVCEYYMENNKPSTLEISKIFNISIYAVTSYLKHGVELNWCDYDPVVAKALARSKNKTKRKIEAWYKNEYLGIFECASSLVKYALDKYNIKLAKNCICQTCTGKQNSTKGFKCKYIN